MKILRRRPGKKTPAGQLAARNDEIRALHKDLDRADKSSDVVAGWARMWRDQTMRARADFLRTEHLRQKAVDKVADLEHQLRVLQDKLDGLQDKRPEDHPTIATPIVEPPKAIGPTVRVYADGAAPFVATDPGCVKPVAWNTIRIPRPEPTTWGQDAAADEDPLGGDPTELLPAVGERTAEHPQHAPAP